MMLTVFCACAMYAQHLILKENIVAKRAELQEKYEGLHLQLNKDLTMLQMDIIDNILTNMSEVYPDSIWISQFEFTVGQWNAINNELCDEEQKNMPMTNVSYGDIYFFLGKLRDFTNLTIELPSVEVWEYSAHGGSNNETTLYVGDDDVNKVAWYKDNSGGKMHPSDGQQGKMPNMLDLYDMSGNVSEICNTPYSDRGLFTICGGDYDSPASEVTIYSRKGIDTNTKDEHVGFRIIIRKESF